MIYCVDIRETDTGNTIETILETTNHDIAYAKAREWNKNNGITDDDIEAYYNEDWFIHNGGTYMKKFADVYHDETR